MKKRINLLILLVLLTTGCTVDYDLVIENDKIVETTTFTQNVNSFYTKSYMLSQFKEEYPIYYDEEFLYYAPNEKVEGNTYYEKKLTEISNGYEATYKANYNIYDYKRSRLLNLAYENFSVGYSGSEKYYFLMANNIKVFKTNSYLDKITVVINLNGYDVIDGNYQSKSGTTYKWVFNRSSKGSINLKYRESKSGGGGATTSKVNGTTSANGRKTTNTVTTNQSSSQKKSRSILDNYIIYIFLVLMIIIVIVGYKWFNNMKNKANMMDD